LLRDNRILFKECFETILGLGVKTNPSLIPEVQNKWDGIDYLVKILIVSLYFVQNFPLDGFSKIQLQSHSEPTNLTLWLQWFQWYLYFLTVHWMSVAFPFSPDFAVNTLNALISRFYNSLLGSWWSFGYWDTLLNTMSLYSLNGIPCNNFAK